jgi:hypothetical protein
MLDPRPPLAGATAGQAGDDDVEDGDDAGDDGVEDGADPVDDGHEAGAYGLEDLFYLEDGYVREGRTKGR